MFLLSNRATARAVGTTRKPPDPEAGARPGTARLRGRQTNESRSRQHHVAATPVGGTVLGVVAALVFPLHIERLDTNRIRLRGPGETRAVYHLERTPALDQPFAEIGVHLPAMPPENVFTDCAGSRTHRRLLPCAGDPPGDELVATCPRRPTDRLRGRRSAASLALGLAMERIRQHGAHRVRKDPSAAERSTHRGRGTGVHRRGYQRSLRAKAKPMAECCGRRNPADPSTRPWRTSPAPAPRSLCPATAGCTNWIPRVGRQLPPASWVRPARYRYRSQWPTAASGPPWDSMSWLWTRSG